MNEETSEKTVRLAFTTAKVTGKVLCRALSLYLQHLRNTKDRAKHGMQTVKQLIAQGQGATTVEVSGGSVGAFKRIANRYGVDFAIKKDKTADTPKYTVFFKAKDLDAVSSVVKEYSARLMKIQKTREKPSIVKELRKIKAEIAENAKKITEKVKEKVR